MPYTPDNDPATYKDRLNDIKRIYPLKSHESAFGHETVRYDNEHAAVVDYMTGIEAGSDEYARLEKTRKALAISAAIGMQSAREAINRMTDSQRATLDEYFAASAPPFLETSYRYAVETGKVASVSEWLTVPAAVFDDTEDTTNRPTGEPLLNVMQWHNDLLEQQAEDPDINARFESFKADFSKVASDMYWKGNIAVEPTLLDDAQLAVGDVFATRMQDMVGYYYPGSNEVTIQQGTGQRHTERKSELLEQFRPTLTHELVHLSLNRALHLEDGLMGQPSSRWLNEALTEETSLYIRQAMGEKECDDGTYREERDLLKLLTWHSDKPDQTAKMATRAFSGDVSDQLKFLQHVDDSWNAKDVIKKINAALAAKERQLRKEGMTRNRNIQTKALRHVYDTLRMDPTELLRASVEEIESAFEKAAR